MPTDRLWRLGKSLRVLERVYENYKSGEVDQDLLDDLLFVKNKVDRIWYELEPQVRRGG